MCSTIVKNVFQGHENITLDQGFPMGGSIGGNRECLGGN